MFNFINNMFSSFVRKRDVDNNQNFKPFDNVAEDNKNLSAVESYMNDMRKQGGVGGMTDHTFGDFLFGAVSTNKAARLNLYRRMANFPEVGDAIDEIAEAMLNFDDQQTAVYAWMDFDRLGMSKDLRATQIQEAIDEYLSLFDFENNMFEYARKLIIDAEIVWENVIDKNHLDDGILAVKMLPTESYEYAIDLDTLNRAGFCVRCNAKNAFSSISDAGTMLGISGQGAQVMLTQSQMEQINNGEMLYLPFEQVTYVNTGDYSSDGMIVYPVLERARKAYNQLQLIEDAILIYRIVRAPERLVFNVDPGDLPRAKAEQEVLKMMQKYQTKKVYNPATGSINNNYDPYTMLECLSMDTKVRLMDGRDLTITEIEAELKTGKELWTYSATPQNCGIVPGKIDFAGVTRKNAEVMRLTFSNGKSEIVTPDHKFPIWGKGDTEVKDMVVGDSLFTFNINDKNQVYDYCDEIWKDLQTLEQAATREGGTPSCLTVANIEKLDYRIDTGCIAIDLHEKYHNYHNFSLSSGVMCNNSFWFVRPSGGQGTEVTTLPGGANLDELKDLNYFIRKLYISLKVPFNRYDQPTTNIELNDSISYEEYRFAKFIIRLQTQFARGLTAGIMTHLKLKKLWTEDMTTRDITVKFVPPSSFELFQSSKVLQNKLANYTAMAVQEEFSKSLLMKKYLGWTDDEIRQNFKMAKDDVIRSGKLEHIKAKVVEAGEWNDPSYGPMAPAAAGGESGAEGGIGGDMGGGEAGGEAPAGF